MKFYSMSNLIWGSIYSQLIILAILTSMVTACSNSEQSKLSRDMHKTSETIQSRIDYEILNEALYLQIRPRTKVTNRNLTDSEIDQRVRQYIVEKYTPAIIKNYTEMYGKLTSENKTFSDCRAPAPIDKHEVVLKALCLKPLKKSVEVHFKTNAYAQGWRDIVVFHFSKASELYKLTSVDIMLTEGQMAYIEGL